MCNWQNKERKPRFLFLLLYSNKKYIGDGLEARSFYKLSKLVCIEISSKPENVAPFWQLI